LTAICSFSLVSLSVQAQAPESHVDGSAPAASIGKINVNQQSYGLSIEISLSVPFVPQGSRVTNPDRLVFDLPGFTPHTENHIPINSGPVLDLRLALFSAKPPVTRVVVDLKEPANFQVKPSKDGIVIEIVFPKQGAIPADAGRQSVPVESEHSFPTAPQNPTEPSVPSAPESRPTSYSLQAKAMALTLTDLQALEDKAASGDPEAETTLALAYHGASLLKRDDAQALRLLHQAADHGYMAAEESLGIFAEKGIGIAEPAPVEALTWYKKAIEHGSRDAATNIALMYADGIGIPKDPAQAIPWFLKAAEAGDATAEYDLSLAYRRGEGIPQNQKESLRWLTAAADQNLVPALLELAGFYMRPWDGTSPDIKRAIPYYAKASDLGSSRAQALLGNIFAIGLDGKPEYEQALKWYRKAVEQGQPDAEFGLGVRYALGQGVPIDLEEALRLFTAAADQGQAGAQYNLAIMYEEGKGASADQSLAVHYFQLAADQGMAKAQFRLGRLLAGNKESRSDQVSAYKWLMLAENTVLESSPALTDLRKSMNPQEIVEAEREVDNWRIAHPENRQ